VTIQEGQQVTWTNEDSTTHTVTGDGFDSGDIAPGESFSHTFDSAGTYQYSCQYHPTMQGTVEVTEATGGGIY
jgi:plastocyanin